MHAMRAAFTHSDAQKGPPAVQADGGAGDALLQRALHMFAPLVRLLLRHGVDHPRLSAALKRAFVNEASTVLKERDQATTFTALSLLTGLQRRDVKSMLDADAPALPHKATSPTLPAQAVARWTNDARFRSRAGLPRPLPLRSSDRSTPTFEQLADSISKDVHAPALVAELVRLGFASFDGGTVTLIDRPRERAPGQEQLLDAMARSTHDHLAAAVTNVIAAEPRFLEYSLFADELRPESAAELQRLARKLWGGAYRRSFDTATRLVERDRKLGFDAAAPNTRIRFGVYFYSEPVQAAVAAKTSDKRRKP
jgi:hypothetical protein